MKSALQVSIMNQTFSIETDATEKHVNQVASLVNKKIREIQTQAKSASSLNVALLACMNIADELISQQNKNEDKKLLAEKKLQDLLEIVDLQL